MSRACVYCLCIYMCVHSALVHPHALIPEMPSCDNRCPRGEDQEDVDGGFGGRLAQGYTTRKERG